MKKCDKKIANFKCSHDFQLTWCVKIITIHQFETKLDSDQKIIDHYVKNYPLCTTANDLTSSNMNHENLHFQKIFHPQKFTGNTLPTELLSILVR